MEEITVRFYGRKKSELGVNYQIIDTFTVESDEELDKAICEKYENVHNVIIIRRN